MDVILLSHGSPDPRAQDAAIELARSVEANLVSGRVHCAFLQHGRSLTDVCQSLADHGIGRVVVVPAFVTPAFHVRVDVPAAVEDAQATSGIVLNVTDPIGADPGLIDALDDLLPSGPVVLAVAGTKEVPALTTLAHVADDWATQRGSDVTVAHASQSTPTVDDAVAASPHASVVAFVLFPGVLPDRISAAATGRFLTPPLCELPETTSVIVRRLGKAVARSAA
jgi:sirohydrochlorin ferrochelatase